jgi:hypothetical protein
MNRGPRPGSTIVDYVAKARAAWGADAPDWVLVVARKAEEVGQAAAGDLIGYRASTISEVISKKYRGDLGRVEQMVRGALMSATVMCPVLDEIGRDLCIQEQSAPFRATNSTRARLRRACRTCQHREVKS